MGNTEEACCQKTCAGFTCPAGTMKRDDESIMGDTKDICCLEVCSAFSCPTGMKLHDNAASIPGNDASACCYELTCAVLTCPEGQVLKDGAESIKGNDVFTCCQPKEPEKKLCNEFTCPEQMVPRENAASIEGEDAATCCLQTCSGFTCPDGMVIRDGADKITVMDGDASTCCSKTCAGFSCPAGKMPCEDAETMTGDDEATCCVQTCSGYGCPTGSILQADAENIMGWDEASCCMKTCSGFTCPPGKTLRPDAAEFTGYDEATCCSQTCQGFACPLGMLIREDAASITGSDEAACCAQTCHGYSCPSGQTLKDGADGIVGGTAAECCEQKGPLLTCGLNCYGDSAIAVPLPNGDGNGISADSIEDCRDACTSTADCEAIVFGQGKCYGKKDVKIDMCQPDGAFQTELLTKFPLGTCIIMGDPHILTFDNPTGQIEDNTQLTAGDYSVAASEQVTIHGRYGYSARFPGEASLTGLSITGPMLKNQKFVVEYTGPDKGESGFKASWNGNEILSGMGTEYKSTDGLLACQKDNMNPDDFHNQARHTIGGETGSGDRPSYLIEVKPDLTIYILLGDETMNAVITMRKQSDLDGYCGNFNCDPNDDTLEELEKRGLAAPLASSNFPQPAPAGQTKASGSGPKSLNDCDPNLLAQAEANCKDAEDAMKEDCMFDICASGDVEAGKEDLITDQVGEEMEAKFSFMGLSLPSLAIAGISPQMQWMLVFSTLSLAAAGFAGGVWSRRLRRGSGSARAGGFSRVAEDEEQALLMSRRAWGQQEPSSYDHVDDEPGSELDA